MRTTAMFLILGFALFPVLPGLSHAQSGDIAIWVKSSDTSWGQLTPIPRNEKYFSIQPLSAYLYYNSGFFENLKDIYVGLTATVKKNDEKIEGYALSRKWKKNGTKEGEFIGTVGEHVVVSLPAFANAITLSLHFRGVGEEKLGPAFDLLQGVGGLGALQWSPGAIARTNVVVPMFRKLFASPFTATNPNQMADVTKSFVIYPFGSGAAVDSLKDGYLVLVSSREDKTDSLKALLDAQSAGSDNIRVRPNQNILEYRATSNSSWTPVTKITYVILAVTTSQTRGTDEEAAWFKKFDEAKSLAIDATREKNAKKKQDALDAYAEGKTLLRSDGSYLSIERDQLIAKYWAALDTELQKFASNGEGLDADRERLGVPQDFARIAFQYDLYRISDSVAVSAYVTDTKGNPFKGKSISATLFQWNSLTTWYDFTDKQSLARLHGIQAQINADGRLSLPDLPIGQWKLVLAVADNVSCESKKPWTVSRPVSESSLKLECKDGGG